MKEADIIIADIKSSINNNDVDEISRIYMKESNNSNLNWGYIYQKVYIHACLKQKHDVVNYLKPMFELLSPIDQIAIRPMFHYGDLLLQKKHKHKKC